MCYRFFRFFILFLVLWLIAGCAHRELDVSSAAALGEPCGSDQVIVRTAYTLGYSAQHRQALWVSYILSGENLALPQVGRSENFRADPLVKKDPVKPQEYRRSGFDRGHLAPAADMAYSRQVMRESFYMTNISPQCPPCNRKSWLAVEKLLRNWAKQEGRLYIVTGPVFMPYRGKVPENFRITVPSGFYKAVLDLTPPYKMIAFYVPNEAVQSQDVKNFTLSVDQLEKLTGLDFFDQLDDDLEKDLEEQNDFDQWGK